MMDGDVVAQFTEITGSGTELATQYLQLTDFNIEQAMQLYFESGGAPLAEEPRLAPHSQRVSDSGARYQDETGVIHIDSEDENMADEPRSWTPPSRPAGIADRSTFEDDAALARRLQEELFADGGDTDTVRAPLARTTETLIGPEADFDAGDMHASVFSQLRAHQARNNRAGIFNQRAEPSIWSGDSEISHRERLSAATGGASEASSKSNMLAELYRPPFEIMSRLPWDMARQEGRDSERWLLVNIQDPSIFDCQVLNRDLWKDPGVKDTVKEHFIFLQYNRDDPRAAPYLQYYFQASNVSDNYPHIAIVDPRTGEQVKVWSGAPVIKPAEFLMQLHEFLDRYSLKHNVRNPVAKRKPEIKEKSLDAMTEEEMMEMALRNSLGDAIAAAPQRLEDPDDLTRSVEDMKGKGKAKGIAAVEPEEVEAESSTFASIPSNRPHIEPPPDPATTTRIQFRHPSGRVIRRFALWDPVQRIYEWLKASPPLEDKAGVGFELNAMGRNLIEELDTTIENAGLKNGTVMIGYMED